jgi:nicotinamidase-related amidase
MKKKALLLVDIQDSFLVGNRWSKRGNLAFEKNVARLLDAWRAAGLPVFFILHNDPDPGFRPGDPEVRLMSFLTRRDDEPLLTKNTRNSFTSTDLERRLRAQGIDHLVVTGISTEQCCETTTRVAADLGFRVDFVTDATQTFPIDELSTAAIFERTEAVLRNRFADIRTTEDLLAEVRSSVTAAAV